MRLAWIDPASIIDDIYIPKYYRDTSELTKLTATHDLLRLGDLIESGDISVATGDEIGKAAYGTGNVPFVRTSDIANWEIKAAPKQGVSEDVYQEYAQAQDVRSGDIFLVRDGTYLIGNTCFVTSIDKEVLYQSHVLKFRVSEKSCLHSALLFLALSSSIVQAHIRSLQFTADTIDTIGSRYVELILPIPKSAELRATLISQVEEALLQRARGKALIKMFPRLIEDALVSASLDRFHEFAGYTDEERAAEIVSETVSAEFGEFSASWLERSSIVNDILLPKYYSLDIKDELAKLAATNEIRSISQLAASGVIEMETGDEIGKAAYGTGPIPFIRTTDFSNWEILHNPKQGVSRDIFEQTKTKQSLANEDILLVRDGTYLVGTSTLVTEEDAESLYCGGLIRIRSVDRDALDPYLLFGLLNSYVVKRQIRARQFTRDVIDTLGGRLGEVLLPIPRDQAVRNGISKIVRETVGVRIAARKTISGLALRMVSPA